jgi:MFS transporter, DHA1 family, tetracycline resistance protein
VRPPARAAGKRRTSGAGPIQTTITRGLASCRRSVEPWYLAYGLVGAATGGVAPIALPIAITRAGDARHVGLVIAAVGLGGLTARHWGKLADHYHCHRGVFLVSALVGTLALAAFGLTTSIPLWLLLALLVGMSQAAANTMANLFVVDAHPEAEWTARIGWLQTFYNAGVAAGLVAIGSVSHLSPDVGLLAGSGAFALAGLVGWTTTRTLLPRPGGPSAAPQRTDWVRLEHVLAAPALHALHVSWAQLSPLRLVHAPPDWRPARLWRAVNSPFGLFLLIWLVANVGPNATYTLYPLLVQQVFDVAPGPSSFALAAATGLGLALYSPSSLVSYRLGATRVLQGGLAVRLAVYLALVGLAGATFGGRGALALVGFALVSLTFPALSVSSTLLTSTLSAGKEGEGMGLYTATAALAGLLGAAGGGWIAAQAGYGATLVVAAAGMAAALALSLLLRAGVPS